MCVYVVCVCVCVCVCVATVLFCTALCVSVCVHTCVPTVLYWSVAQSRQNEQLLLRCEENQEVIKEQGEQLVEREVRIEELLHKLKVCAHMSHIAQCRRHYLHLCEDNMVKYCMSSKFSVYLYEL